MFAIFGTRVTVLQGGPQLLAREDPDVAAEVARVLTDQGVEVRLGARATAVRRDDVRHVVVTLDDGVDVRGEELLVATGRTPVTADHVWAAGEAQGRAAGDGRCPGRVRHLRMWGACGRR